TVVGPHRDDLELRLDGQAAALYASRGQARSIALALKLAEAHFVSEMTGRRPVLALDDVLSELDRERRRLVLEAAAEYEQVLLTTTDFDLVEPSFLAAASRYEVDAGQVAPAGS
ncbi:MAG: DNA replication/repair protein RecF, partial [Gemmatimonadetes bacterium]|nr:DNA replication/repair protein RecF [Gemmatimonadota bacterium]